MKACEEILWMHVCLFVCVCVCVGVVIRCYADDTHLSMKPDEMIQLPKIKACLKDVKAWMTNNSPAPNRHVAAVCVSAVAL